MWRDANVFSGLCPSMPQNLEMPQHPAGPSFLACSHVLLWCTPCPCHSPYLGLPTPFCTTEVDNAPHLPLQRSLHHSLSLQRKARTQLLKPEIRKLTLTLSSLSLSLLSSPLSILDSHTHPVNHQVLNQLPSKSLRSICISHPSCHCPSPLTSTSHKICCNSLIGLPYPLMFPSNLLCTSAKSSFHTDLVMSFPWLTVSCV